MNSVKNLELHLMELNDSIKNIVVNGLEATECHILLSELDKTLTRGKEAIVRENCCYAEAVKNIGNLAREKEHNDELTELFSIASLMTPVRKIKAPFYTKEECEKLAQNIKNDIKNAQEVYKEHVKTDTKQKYELEFKDKVGCYTLYFKNDIRCYSENIDIFKQSRLYAHTRLVKALVEDPESYIESFNLNENYIIIRNDNIDKFVIFTRTYANDDFYYLAPEEYCKDADRI